MEETYHQQADPAFQLQRCKVQSVGKQHIRHQHHNCRNKLDQCALDSVYILDKLVHQHHAGIKTRCTQPAQDAQ